MAEKCLVKKNDYPIGSTALCSGSPTNPKEELKMRMTKLDLMAEMLNFSLMTSCRLINISLCQTLGGAWWVLGYILVIKGETERNYMHSLC